MGDKWSKFLGNELALQDRPGHGQKRTEGRSRHWTCGSLFPVAGAMEFEGGEGELGYCNSLVGIDKLLRHVI